MGRSCSLCKMNQQDVLASDENLIYVPSEHLLVIHLGLSLFLTGLAPRKGGGPGEGTSPTGPFCPHSPPRQLGPGLFPCRRLQGRRDGAGAPVGAAVGVPSSPHRSHLPSGCLGVPRQGGVLNGRLGIRFLFGGILKFQPIKQLQGKQ